jgi:hypothetical protein
MTSNLRCASIACALTLIAATLPALCGSIDLAWDAVPGAQGYRVYFGTTPQQYTGVVDVGNTTATELSGLDDCRTYHVAVKAYNTAGESAEFSEPVSGWSRPAVTGYTPSSVQQGDQVTLQISGANFDSDASLALVADPYPTDLAGAPLVRLESVSVVDCNEIQALVTVEPTARGFRAMTIGDLDFAFEIVNPDSVFGRAAAILDVALDPTRLDINDVDSATRERVDGQDLAWLAYSHGSTEGTERFNPNADINGDGLVDGEDLALLATGFGLCWSGEAWTPGACP